MSNLLAAGNAQTPGQPSQNGQQDGGNADNNNDAPVVLSADDQAAQAAADQADAAAAAAHGEQPPGDGGTPNTIPEPRFKEVIAERNAAMEFGRYWQDVALRGAAAVAAGQPAAGGAPGQPQQPQQPAIDISDPNDPQPTLEQHGHDANKWAAANNAWMARAIQRGVVAGIAAAQTTQRQQTEAEEVQQNWDTRVAKFRATTPDFDAVTQNPTLPINATMAAAIMRSELGPQLYHHLGKNPTEAARISRLPAPQQALALARLEGRLAAAAPAPGAAGAAGAPAPAGARSAPGTPARTQAPQPPSSTRPGAQGEVNLMNCSIEDYLAQRLPQIAASKGARRSG